MAPRQRWWAVMGPSPGCVCRALIRRRCFAAFLTRLAAAPSSVAPEDLVESRQFYEPDSGVLVTEMRGQSGVLRLTDALALRADSLCARASPVGLLPEQIDPGSGAFIGNYPQAFSHIGVISSGMNLGRLLQEARA